MIAYIIYTTATMLLVATNFIVAAHNQVYTYELAALISALLLSVWIGITMHCFLNTNKTKAKTERDMIELQLQKYKDSLLEVKDSEMNFVLRKANDMNRIIDLSNKYCKNIWVGWFYDKGYYGLTLIDTAKNKR